LLNPEKAFIHSLSVDKLLIDFDTEKDRDLIELFTSTNSSSVANDLSHLKAFLPDRIIVRRASVKINDKGSIILISPVSIQAKNRGSSVSVSADSSISVVLSEKGSSAYLPFVKAGLKKAMITLKLDGSVSDFFRTGSMKLNLKSLQTDLFSLKAHTFSIVYSPESIDVHKINDRNPIDIHFSHRWIPKKLHLIW
jgi:hypothetical protein